jgi:hypothetical protein
VALRFSNRAQGDQAGTESSCLDLGLEWNPSQFCALLNCVLLVVQWPWLTQGLPAWQGNEGGTGQLFLLILALPACHRQGHQTQGKACLPAQAEWEGGERL